MAYTKQGPWSQGSPFSADQATAMDDGIAAAATLSFMDLGSASGAIVLDAGAATVFKLTLTAAATITLANLHVTGTLGRVTLLLTAAGQAVTWGGTVVFTGGNPALTGAPNIIEFRGTPTDTSDYAVLVGTY